MQGFPQFNVIPAMSECMKQKNKLIKIGVNWFQNTMSLSSLTTKYHILFSSITLHSAPESFKLFSVLEKL
jgi:hypothetical protein